MANPALSADPRPMRDDTAPRSPLLITAIQLGLLLLAIYYTFIGGQTAQGIYDHRWRSITLWLTTILIGSWLLWRLMGRYKIPRTSFDFPLLFILVFLPVRPIGFYRE